MPLCKSEIFFDFGKDGIRIDTGKTAVIGVDALLLAVDGAGTARKIQLDAVIILLAESLEPGNRMCGAPNGDNRSIGE